MIWFAVVVCAGVLTYWWSLRRVCRTWGACDEERFQPMIGDDLVPFATYEATQAITIDAPPKRVWPWLVQMGYGRGGLYSYDWLDRLAGHLNCPSSERLLPEFQHLSPGDTVPIGRATELPVRVVTPTRTLAVGGEGDASRWAWEFDLHPQEFGRTRLVSRQRSRGRRSLASRLFLLLLEPASFVMTRKMLRGIKRRAETIAAGTEQGRG